MVFCFQAIFFPVPHQPDPRIPKNKFVLLSFKKARPEEVNNSIIIVITILGNAEFRQELAIQAKSQG